jgi:ribonuclease HII
MPCAESMTANKKGKSRTNPTIEYEKRLWSGGYSYVAGLDEAGRGCWAGPVTAAAVILPTDVGIQKKLEGVRDSKQMTARQRAFWAEEIKCAALCFGIGFSTHKEIDKKGIVAATRLAMLRALQALSIEPQFLLLDYMLLPNFDLPQISLVRGDGQVLSIAAASILAKTSRDEWMVEIETRYPGYGFTQHKGYGTAQHRDHLAKLGISAIHRRSFAPVRQVLLGETK